MLPTSFLVGFDSTSFKAAIYLFSSFGKSGKLTYSSGDELTAISKSSRTLHKVDGDASIIC
jgi:hypothetical protein